MFDGIGFELFCTFVQLFSHANTAFDPIALELNIF